VYVVVKLVWKLNLKLQAFPIIYFSSTAIVSSFSRVCQFMLCIYFTKIQLLQNEGFIRQSFIEDLLKRDSEVEQNNIPIPLMAIVRKR
jgi:hypothetical protein